MPVLRNIGYLATCKPEGLLSDIHALTDAAIAWENEKISWIGKDADVPEAYHREPVYDARQQMVIPGLVDCHTHLAFGGWRPDEFAMRVQGKSYLEIAKAGGGIRSTVKHTRAASEQELFDKAQSLAHEMIRLGVTTIECKSGYGLSVEDELKTLRVYRRLNEALPITIVPTFLGAHTIPPEFDDRREAYIDLVINEMLPAVAEEGLAEFCDIFVEDSAFSVDEARRIYKRGKELGLTPKVHADQLTSCGGAELAAEMGAASADHLEQISEEGIAAMAKAGVVAVNLPLASLYTQQPFLNARKLVKAGVDVAIATDFNPGSAPSYDLPLAMMLTCNTGGLTPAEVLKSVTINAAKAIQREDTLGSIEVGKRADLAVIDTPDPNFWMYHFRPNACSDLFIGGESYQPQA
jgi:imidazolonepropionase